MAKKADAKPATGKKTGKKAASPRKARAAEADTLAGASTSPITDDPVAARLVGDQLRGIAYLAKKIALAIEEKQLRIPLDPAAVKELSDRAYSLADDLRPAGDDGSNGG
jgi:hypothetical protein